MIDLEGGNLPATAQPQTDKPKGNNPFGYDYYPAFLKKASHPGMCLLHFFFKAAALVSYMFLNLFIGNYTLTFIVVILLSVFDFWSVKNLTGRILVGLRWWSQVNPDGTEEWKFEGLNEKKSGGVDYWIFWGVLYLAPIVWTVFMVSSALSFALYNISLCAACLVLSATNLIGYIKCSKDHKKSMTGFIAGQAAQNISPTDMMKMA